MYVYGNQVKRKILDSLFMSEVFESEKQKIITIAILSLYFKLFSFKKFIDSHKLTKKEYDKYLKKINKHYYPDAKLYE